MGRDWAVKALQWYQNKRLQKNVSTRRRRNRTNHRCTLPEDPCSLSCRECGRTRYPMSWGIFLQTASCCAAECQDITKELQQMCTSLMNAMGDSWSGFECSVMARAFLPGHHSILVVPCSYKCSFSVSIGSKTSTPRPPCDDTEILAMGAGDGWIRRSLSRC
jgi:hypothetical protein